jgi:hypothetical protein
MTTFQALVTLLFAALVVGIPLVGVRVLEHKFR